MNEIADELLYAIRYATSFRPGRCPQPATELRAAEVIEACVYSTLRTQPDGLWDFARLARDLER